ncbi:GIY-YIG nuclease family protein [Paracoccus versutus]|uniref:GIY-YIG nuclease family protein n=1 Tax=Paracoccus versutus TaxID=34007 RepID=UPI001FB70E39|nr:GIY-YIG nuclease family protein [Paracoccus versutus]MCJ1903110.1 GIY-YIG nuclease family protein [Paracoccus versutus]
MDLDAECPKDAGVYAFVVARTVRYVGSAQRGLRGRFRRYATTGTMRTSARVRDEILACLTQGQPVEIYTLTPPPYEWNGLPVDLVAGIEEGLIRSLRPAWNRRSNRD